MKASPKLADATKRVLAANGEGKRPMPIRQVEMKTGLSYGLINGMIAGRIPGADMIIRFAACFSEDVVSWLKMCGYDDMARIIQEERGERPTGPLEMLLEAVPEHKREVATEAAKRAITTLIVPLLIEAA